MMFIITNDYHIIWTFCLVWLIIWILSKYPEFKVEYTNISIYLKYLKGAPRSMINCNECPLMVVVGAFMVGQTWYLSFFLHEYNSWYSWPISGLMVGSLNHFTPKFCFGALFGPNKVLETHLALLLDQLL